MADPRSPQGSFDFSSIVSLFCGRDNSISLSSDSLGFPSVVSSLLPSLSSKFSIRVTVLLNSRISMWFISLFRFPFVVTVSISELLE